MIWYGQKFYFSQIFIFLSFFPFELPSQSLNPLINAELHTGLVLQPEFFVFNGCNDIVNILKITLRLSIRRRISINNGPLRSWWHPSWWHPLDHPLSKFTFLARERSQMNSFNNQHHTALILTLSSSKTSGLALTMDMAMKKAAMGTGRLIWSKSTFFATLLKEVPRMSLSRYVYQ